MIQVRKAIGFGFIPEEDEHHFLVKIPRATSKDKNVRIYERFKWQEYDNKQVINLMKDKLKAEIPKEKWDVISKPLELEFKARLKENNIGVYRQAKWKVGDNPVDRLLGKELLLLVWSIEDCQINVINTAIRNWLGLDIAERWWLYTMTNAATGGAYDRNGWRRAIKYALSENPIEETEDSQMDWFGV